MAHSCVVIFPSYDHLITNFCITNQLASSAEMAVSVLLLLLGLTVGGLGGRANAADDTYLIGAGRYDVTGPAAEIEMVCVCADLVQRATAPLQKY